MKPEAAVAAWKPRIYWPDVEPKALVADALEHVREHQASVAHERHIPDDLARRGSPCPRKAVTNYVREEHSSYPLAIEGKPRLVMELARDKANRLISEHYVGIRCTCGRCP